MRFYVRESNASIWIYAVITDKYKQMVMQTVYDPSGINRISSLLLTMIAKQHDNVAKTIQVDVATILIVITIAIHLK